MSSGKPGLWKRDSGAAATETEENLLAHPMVRIHEQTRTRVPFLTSYRVGLTSVCSDGAVVPRVVQAHGLARFPGVVLHRRRSQMTRTQGIMTTFSAFCAQTTGMLLPIVWDHEASTALTQTYRSSGCLGLKGNRPAGLRSQSRRRRVAYIDGSGGQAYLIKSRWNGSVH
jgi:hypothetical protein